MNNFEEHLFKLVKEFYTLKQTKLNFEKYFQERLKIFVKNGFKDFYNLLMTSSIEEFDLKYKQWESNLLKNMVFEGNMTLESLLCVCVNVREDVTIQEIKGKSRRRDFADVRFVYYKIAKKFNVSTNQNIAGYINRNHTIVTYGCKKCDDYIETNEKFREYFNKCFAVFSDKARQD